MLLAKVHQPKDKWTVFLLSLLLAYTSLWLLSRTAFYFMPPGALAQKPYHGPGAHYFVISFFLFFTPLLYLFNCLLAKRWLTLKKADLVLYMGATFACGVSAEVLVNSTFEWAVGRPAWRYIILPRHNGDTSAATAVIWPLYGFYLYLFHQALAIRLSQAATQSPFYAGAFIGIDAMVLEALANLFALWAFDRYYFYYIRADLMHLTTLEILIPYMVFGILGMLLLQRLTRVSSCCKALLGVVFYLLGLSVILCGG